MARRKSFNLGGGTRINLSKSGIGVSAGVKGFRVSAGPRGTRLTTKNPLTGKRSSVNLGSSSGSRSRRSSPTHTATPVTAPVTASNFFTHYHVVRLSTTYLNHEKEMASIAKAMGKKGWALQSRQSTSNEGKETVSVLTFEQVTKKKKAPKPPIKGNVTKKGGLLARLFS